MSQGDVGRLGFERNLSAAGQTQASPKVDDLRAAGDRPPNSQADIPEEVPVAELIAVAPLAQKRMQARERPRHALEHTRGGDRALRGGSGGPRQDARSAPG